jgi:hypothetical protein
MSRQWDSERDSRLRCYMNLQAFADMTGRPSNGLDAIRAAGYDGVQIADPFDLRLIEEAQRVGLSVCGNGRVSAPAEAGPMAKQAREAGLECVTLHVGWGTESDAEAEWLIQAVLDAQAAHGIPLYPETHRATIFQDPWRTVQFVSRFPQLRFNGDFSHWYTGTEMVYGGFENKLEFIRPVLESVGFLHGRIGNSCCMQVDVGDGSGEGIPSVGHFRTLWTESFSGFLKRDAQQGSICFTPELLGPEYNYARLCSGREESDRWQQSLVLVRIAEECFTQAALRSGR